MKIALASSSSESSARDEWRYDYSERERERGENGNSLAHPHKLDFRFGLRFLKCSFACGRFQDKKMHGCAFPFCSRVRVVEDWGTCSCKLHTA